MIPYLKTAFYISVTFYILETGQSLKDIIIPLHSFNFNLTVLFFIIYFQIIPLLTPLAALVKPGTRRTVEGDPLELPRGGDEAGIEYQAAGGCGCWRRPGFN